MSRMSDIAAFFPMSLGTVSKTAGTTAVTAALWSVATSSYPRRVLITNTHTGTVFVETGSAPVQTATTTASMPIATGQSRIITPGGPIFSIASATIFGSGAVYFTPGEGS